VEDILEYLANNDTGVGLYFDLKKLLILLITIYFCTGCITMASEELCMNGSKFTFIIDSRSKLFSDWLKTIYYGFVHPRILYGIEVYVNTFDTHLDKLRKLNNKILRIIQNKPK